MTTDTLDDLDSFLDDDEIQERYNTLTDEGKKKFSDTFKSKVSDFLESGVLADETLEGVADRLQEIIDEAFEEAGEPKKETHPLDLLRHLW